MRRAYINFLYWIDKKPPQNKDLQTYLNLFVLNTAYAANQKVCFFAGWPSTYENGVCRNPQNLNAQPHIQNIDKYAPDDACTGSKRFRCNPALFGEPSIFDRRQSNDTKEIEGVLVYMDNATKIDYLLERGDFCVNTDGTFKDLSEKCEKVSDSNIEGLARYYSDNLWEIIIF